MECAHRFSVARVGVAERAGLLTRLRVGLVDLVDTDCPPWCPPAARVAAAGRL